MEKKTIIVPHDFTPVADNAFNHALNTAKIAGAQVYLRHVVSKDKAIQEAETKLKEIISSKNSDVSITPVVRVGNIFDDIGDFASEVHAELIFMGTHGQHGW